MTKQVYASKSRLEIAQIVDTILVKTIGLFDLSSIKKLDQWLIRYAREKIFQKMQTLWIMGKQKEFLELLDYVEKEIPRLRELANNSDIWISTNGKILNPKNFEVWREKKPPKKVKDLIEQDKFWRKIAGNEPQRS